MADENPPPGNGSEKVVAFKRKPAEPTPPPAESQYQAEENVRIRTNLMALVLAAVLVLVGWLLVRKLGETTRIEDCLMSGRTNCAPIAATPRDE
jgi:hypothetical protein